MARRLTFSDLGLDRQELIGDTLRIGFNARCRTISWPPITIASRSIWPAGMPRAWVPMHRSSSR